MPPTDLPPLTVGRARLAVPRSVDRIRGRLRADAALGSVETGAGEGREVLVVRRIRGSLARGREGAASFRGRLAREIGELRGSAVRVEAGGGVEAHRAPAVLFDGPDALLLSLVLELEDGSARGSWYWRELRGFFPGGIPTSPAEALARRPRETPGILARARRLGRLPAVAASLDEDGARAGLRALAGAHGMSGLVEELEGRRPYPPSGGDEASGPGVSGKGGAGGRSPERSPGTSRAGTGGGARSQSGDDGAGEPGGVADRSSSGGGGLGSGTGSGMPGGPWARALVAASLALADRPGATGAARRAAAGMLRRTSARPAHDGEEKGAAPVDRSREGRERRSREAGGERADGARMEGAGRRAAEGDPDAGATAPTGEARAREGTNRAAAPGSDGGSGQRAVPGEMSAGVPPAARRWARDGSAGAGAAAQPLENGSVSAAGPASERRPGVDRDGDAEPWSAVPARDEDEGSGTPRVDPPKGRRTDLGGVFFLVRLLEAEGGITEEAGRDWIGRRGGWPVVEAVARRLVGRLTVDGDVLREDGVWEVLAELRSQEAPPGGEDWERWVEERAEAAGRELRSRLGPEGRLPEVLARALLRPAGVRADGTHVDVRFSLEDADLEIRRAGLDLDPGWVPWLGRVILFHYR